MDWQQWVALAIVATTVAVFLRSHFRPRKFSFVRNLSCSCAAGRETPRHTVVYRARKGERPQVTLKMK